MTYLKQNKLAVWLTTLSVDEAGYLDDMIRLDYGPRRLNAKGQLLDGHMSQLGSMIFLMYESKWAHLYKSYIVEYHPEWNVDGQTIETEIRDLVASHIGMDTFTDSGDDVTQTRGTDTTINTGSSSTAENVYGFDDTSTDGTPSSKTTVTPNLTEKLQHGRTDTLTHGKSTAEDRNLTDTDSGTVETTTIRTGNIGVTTTAQLLDGDTKLWNEEKMLFFKTVTRDIADYITYKIDVD